MPIGIKVSHGAGQSASGASDWPPCIAVLHHWICTYYDAGTDILHIYDSMNFGRLVEEQKAFLRKLFPKFECLTLHFPRVQQQSNGVDCGVFAIAFATSVLCGFKPEEECYDQDKM